jgi:hypothetical protein
MRAPALALLLASCAASVVVPSDVEPDTNRLGGDFRTVDLDQYDAAACRAECDKDPRCASFTLVRPGIQTARARCWLKGNVPTALQNECCLSGVKRPPPPPIAAVGLSIELETNRSGADFRDFDLEVSDASHCQAACQAEPRCLAYTWVKPGLQGEKSRCWLKSAVPEARPSGCCVSGQRLTVAGAAPPRRS